MTGPQQQRLQHYLSGTRQQQAADAAFEWSLAASLLRRVSDQLRVHGQQPPTGRIGRDTALAIGAAFTRSAEAMTTKADELDAGAQALTAAADELTRAEQTRADLQGSGLGARPSPLTFTGPMTAKDVREDSQRNAEIAAWDAEHERRERQAREAADRMDATFADSSAALRRIHRETPPQDRAPSAPGGGQQPGTAPPAAPGHATGPGGGVRDTSAAPQTGQADDGHYNPQAPTDTSHATDPSDSSEPSDANSTTLGVPQGPGGTTGTATPAPAVLAGGSGASTGPVPSVGAGAALGGLALGGAMIAGGSAPAGGVRGGLAPTSSGSAQGPRPIGASSTRGSAPTLGRGAVPGTAATASGTQGRASGRTAAAGGNAGSRTTIGRSGAAAAAGERRGTSGGTGAGAGSGRGRRDKSQRGGATAGYVEEWELDDSEAAPGVLD